MAKTNWQDPSTSEIRSTQISGLQEAVGKIEESIGMNSVAGTNIPLAEVFISNDDRYRIFQAPIGKRNWLISPDPVVKKNGVIITSGFEIDYGGGAIVLNVNDTVANAYTVDATYTVANSEMPYVFKNLQNGKVYRYTDRVSSEGVPQRTYEEVK